MRLADIDPAALADAMHAQVAERARRLAFATGHDLVSGGAGVSDVRHAVRLLAEYAISGAAPEGDRDLVPEYLQSIVDVDIVPDGDTMTGARDPDDALEIVVLAALARDAIAHEATTAVPDGWIAVLAGVAASRVRQLAAAGELARVEGEEGIEVESARRWLQARCVADV